MVATDLGKLDKQEAALPGELRLHDLEMVADVFQCIPGRLIEDPVLVFMMIDRIRQQRHQNAILNILLRVFSLVLSDAGIDIVYCFTYKHLFLLRYFERDFATGDIGFYAIHTDYLSKRDSTWGRHFSISFMMPLISLRVSCFH